MRFVLIHKICSYLTVLTATVAVALSGALNPVVMAFVVLGIATSWFWEPPRVAVGRYERAWNVAALIALLLLMADLFLSGSLIINGVYFLLILLLNRLFNRRSSRDYLRIYLISFLQIVSSTVINTDISFGICFLFYVVFTTWTLVLFFLKREMEDNYLLKYGDSLKGRPVQVDRVLNSRKLVGPRFLAVTSLVSLAVFAGALTVFVLFPRVGFGLFFRKERGGITMAGFSDRVQLGSFGRIKDDPTVVMRIEFPSPDQRSVLDPYWRGISFDHYDGQTWTKSHRHRKSARKARPGLYRTTPAMTPDPLQDPAASTVIQEIYLEPMETHVLFGLSRLVGIRLDPPKAKMLPTYGRAVYVDLDHDAYYEQRNHLSFRYRAFSVPAVIPPRTLAIPLSDYLHHVEQRIRRSPSARRYLQLPAALDPRVESLARELTRGAHTIGEVLDRVERHLRREYGYTLEQDWSQDLSPLADFLFERRQGHCEYFSTAMVILLRTLGIAARSTNGFYGGTWNSYGDYLAVRQGDAHSWVEVWLPDNQWMTRDPTPSGPGSVASSALWSLALQYLDALRLRWYKYVIEYDLDTQISVAHALRAAWRGLVGEQRPSAPDASGSRWSRWSVAWALGAGMVLLLIGWGLGRRRWRPRVGESWRARPHAVAVARLFERLVDAYAKLGHVRPATATAREFVALLERADAPELGVARRVAALYEAVRFGGSNLDTGALHDLERAIKGIRPPVIDAGNRSPPPT